MHYISVIVAQLCNGSIECDLDAVSLTDHREQHESNVKVAFSMFDKDGDGVITCTELLDVMVSLGFDVNSHEVQNIIKKIDLDGACVTFNLCVINI